MAAGAAKATARRLYGRNQAYTRAVNRALRGGASQYQAHRAGMRAAGATGRGAAASGAGDR